jgi:hypothetical protein
MQSDIGPSFGTLEENHFVSKPFLPYNTLLSLKMPYFPL